MNTGEPLQLPRQKEAQWSFSNGSDFHRVCRATEERVLTSRRAPTGHKLLNHFSISFSVAPVGGHFTLRLKSISAKTITKVTMKTFLLLLVLTSALGMSGCVTSRMFSEGPTTKVNLAGWHNLEVGMTKEQVISLLGNAPSKSVPEIMKESGKTIYFPEFWEYNYTSGLTLIPQPHPKSYHVYFDKQGRLANWGGPEATGKDKK